LRQESPDEAAAGSNAAYNPAKVKERVANLQLVEARYRLLVANRSSVNR
jgi:hypothetical protein